MTDRKLNLKPCPCCGGEAGVTKKSGRSVLHTGYWSGYAFCKRCRMATPMLKSPAAVEKVWNRRINETVKEPTQ